MATVMVACAMPSHATEPMTLPAPVRQALARGQLPAEALSAWVQAVDEPAPRLAWQARQPQNPASLAKLITTQAALELLGPAFSWTTPVWLQGSIKDGVLDGALVIKGQGDPKLVVERIWLLLRRVQQLGVREIRGDIVLDRSAFSVADTSPADFDGEPLRPYNARADALLLNYRSVIYSFTPDLAAGVARVGVEPPLTGLQADSQVPLAAGPCEDWRGALKASPADPQRMRFGGSYATSCGERIWPLAYADPASYNARVLSAMWRALGGTLTGSVKDGPAPASAPSFVFTSPPLAEVVRDINKYSNNVMAQQLFLTLGLQLRGNGTPDNGRAVIRQWLSQTLGDQAEALVVDNGSGLSRDSRVTAEALARLLLKAWRSPTMPELMSSLPVSGLDGTLRRSQAPLGRAHLKTGSLRDVNGIAGYVLGADGRHHVLVAIVNHPQAGAARPALDALVQWAQGAEAAQGR